MGTVALVLLLAWLVTTAIMTFGTRRLVSQHDTGAMRQLDGQRLTTPPTRLTAPPANDQETPEKSR
ncbi:MAG TPA: hypothetical protein VF116_13070 [Ktedonobacterales bacterium]